MSEHEAITKALVSAGNCMAFHPRDWAADRRDAWLWGIVCGWDEESLAELAERHGWGPTDVDRLRWLRAAIEDATAGA